eukprot:INCI17600.4.p1 GENE.INCI17600.4~~INCI17600.4.p1  ORF type:complete len:140 (-),score=25.56 INCI17600.4:103-522(-)
MGRLRSTNHTGGATNRGSENDDDLMLRFCLNINPLQSLYCMAKADVFAASDSYFSTLVSVTSPSVKIIPELNFFENHLCERTDICNVEDELTITNDEVNAENLHRGLVRAAQRHAEQLELHKERTRKHQMQLAGNELSQ